MVEKAFTPQSRFELPLDICAECRHGQQKFGLPDIQTDLAYLLPGTILGTQLNVLIRPIKIPSQPLPGLPWAVHCYCASCSRG